MPIGQRVALIGGGHNALITAFYLAKGGFKPLVLERREILGGGAITEEFHPGFHASTLSHSVGPLRADIARDLDFDKFDCEILQPDPRVFAPRPDGESLLFYDSAARTAGGIARLSPKDAAKYTQFAERRSTNFSPFFGQLFPSLLRPSIRRLPEDFWNLFKAGRSVRSLGKQRHLRSSSLGPHGRRRFRLRIFRNGSAPRGHRGTRHLRHRSRPLVRRFHRRSSSPRRSGLSSRWLRRFSAWWAWLSHSRSSRCRSQSRRRTPHQRRSPGHPRQRWRRRWSRPRRWRRN